MKPQHKQSLIIFSLFILLIISSFFISKFISLQNIVHNRKILTLFVSQHYAISLTLFFFIYITCSALALPITTLLTLVGGFLFGGLIGGTFTIIAATTGATTTFLIVRHLLYDFIQTRYTKQALWLNKQLKLYGKKYLLAIRLMMLLPFFLINILSGLLPLTLFEFISITLLGIIPSSFVYAFAGQKLAAITSLSDILSPPIVIMLLLLGSIAIFLPKAIEQFQKKPHKISG